MGNIVASKLLEPGRNEGRGYPVLMDDGKTFGVTFGYSLGEFALIALDGEQAGKTRKVPLTACLTLLDLKKLDPRQKALWQEAAKQWPDFKGIYPTSMNVGHGVWADYD